MYLNEFDAYVRHVIKPLAYVRYGDDFIIICPTEVDLRRARKFGTEKLSQLGLNVNGTQDKIVRSWQGLHFLGHIVTKDGSVISRKTKNLMLRRINLQNVSSYASLKTDKEVERAIPWLVDLR